MTRHEGPMKISLRSLVVTRRDRGVLGQEAVAGVNGRGAGVVGDGQDFVGVVIGGHLIEGFFPTKFFGDAYVTGMDVLGRMHANEFQAQFTAGLNDAHGDFSSVGYEDFMFCFLHRCTSCMICRLRSGALPVAGRLARYGFSPAPFPACRCGELLRV